MTDVLAGRYELRSVIGSGGMAHVYEAFDRNLHRPVAVKVMRADAMLDRRNEQRFLREARAAASFAHPHAVAVFDAGKDDDRLYIVMELVQGRTLASLLTERGQLDPGEALAIIDPILDALGAAHRRDMVHRDVKPANILLTPEGGAKLADFGIAKGVQEATGGLTATGQVMGTPKYLSPEQVSGGRASPATDVYAAGIVLYEVLAGRPPFVGDHPIAVALAHKREPVPPLQDHRPDLPPQLAATVHRALEKDPADRFADGGAFRDALRGAAGGTLALEIDQTAPTALGGIAAAAVAGAGPDAPRDVGGDWGADPEPVPTATTVTSAGRSLDGKWIVVAVAGLALLALLLFVAAQASEQPASAPITLLTPPTAIQPTTPPTTPATTPATPTPTEPALPADLTSLVGLLAGDPQAFGEKGPELRDKLIEVLEKQGREQHDKARDLVEKVEEWVEDGKLDPEIGALAVRLLEPLAELAPEGRDRGRGDDDDDDDD